MNDSRNGMLIRDQYIQAFDAIKGKYGEETSEWRIGRNVSLKQAIGYTGQYVIRHKKKHFRYDYYRRKLGEAMYNLHPNPMSGSILCMDMGCGPSLFSWVVQDYISSHLMNNGSIGIIGYDHAEKMIQLSEEFRGYFINKCDIKYDWRGYWEIDHLKHNLERRDFSEHNIIVTLGYVLIQIKDKDNGRVMREFSEVIRSLYPVKSCIVVAVDAFSDFQWCQEFRDGWKRFQKALCDAGVNCESERCGSQYSYDSYAYARLDRRG